MIVHTALYRDGHRDDSIRSLPRMAAAAKQDPDAFVWMSLHEPSESDVLGVARLFGLHPLAAEDVVHARQRPKLDVYDDVIFLVVRPVWLDDTGEGVDTGELMLFLGRHFLVTVSHGPRKPVEDIRDRLENTAELGQQGPGAVLHAIVDAVVDDYVQVSQQLEDVVSDVEDCVFADERYSDSGRIYRLKREVHQFRRAVVPLEEPLHQLTNGAAAKFFDPGIHPFLEDVRDHVARVGDAIDAYDRQLSDIVSAHLAQLGVQQNEDMRKISAWVALAAVPTVIAAIYGMNFQNMPELRWHYGYFMALALMGALAGSIWAALKRSGWL